MATTFLIWQPLSDEELAKWKIAVVSFGTLPPSLYGNHLPNMATTER